MADLKIPVGPEALTPDWLTQALRSTGAITNATVESFDRRILGEGQGFTGRIVRLRGHGK
jgi:hypothetical protein